MAVEDADDLASFFDVDEFGATARWRAAALGAGLEVVGIFSAGYLGQGLGALAGDGREITFRCQAAALEGAAQGDTLEVGGVVYRVRSVRPDGTGLVLLVLGS